MNARRDAIRRAVRVSARDLRPGDTCQPWNDRAAPHRTVIEVCPMAGDSIVVRWDDGDIERLPNRTAYHRSNIRL